MHNIAENIVEALRRLNKPLTLHEWVPGQTNAAVPAPAPGTYYDSLMIGFDTPEGLVKVEFPCTATTEEILEAIHKAAI